jgi:hypothetical protein
MADIIHLKTEQIDAHYDAEARLLMVSYSGILSSDVTEQFYAWLLPIIQASPHLLAAARGSIYDFCAVTHFRPDNLTTARRQSSNLSQANDIHDHPVALIAGTIFQERMVKTMMRLTEQTSRKRVVNSMEEAIEFINSWQEKKIE